MKISFGKGRQLRLQSQQIICNVRDYLKAKNVKSLMKTVSMATLVPIDTLKGLFNRYLIDNYYYWH
jgi:PleD family two-component response regulator